jgi:hypothetical protein
MGGAGCMKIGLARPQNYAAIGCLSAGADNHPKDKDGRRDINPRWAERMRIVYGDRDTDGTEEDVLYNARKLAESGGPFPRIYHSIGRDDFLLDAAHQTRDFFQGLAGNPSATPTMKTPAPTPGNTGTSIFRNSSDSSAQWLNRKRPDPQLGSGLFLSFHTFLIHQDASGIAAIRTNRSSSSPGIIVS